MKHLNCKLYYQQLHLKYLCNLARYWLQAVWGWHDSGETCSSVIICEIILHLLVIVHNNKKQCLRFFLACCVFLNNSLLSNISGSFPPNRKAVTDSHHSNRFICMHKFVVFSHLSFANTQFKKWKNGRQRLKRNAVRCGKGKAVSLMGSIWLTHQDIMWRGLYPPSSRL